MAGTTGAPLNLYLPGGGSSGLYDPDESLDVDRLNQNFEDINDGYADILTGSVPVASSSSARDALFPTPVQGNRVCRTDLMYEEAYFDTYNASTNKGGALAAGWYPVGGNVPRCILTKTTAQNTVNGTVNVNWGNVVQDRFSLYAGGSPTRITIATPGLYRIHARLSASGGITLGLSILVNGVATGQGSGNGSSAETVAYAQLAAGDYLEVRVQATSVAALATSPVCAFDVEWVEPRTA